MTMRALSAANAADRSSDGSAWQRGAADRPPVAHDGVGDHLLGVLQDREVLVPTAAESSSSACLVSAPIRSSPPSTSERRLAEPVDVDQGLRLREPQLHHRDQAMPA